MRINAFLKRPLKRLLIGVLIVTMLLLLANKGMGVLARKLYPLKYGEYVEEYCKEYNIDKYFCYAFIKCESNFKEDATSSAGARGLMQLMPETFEWIGGRLMGETPPTQLICEPQYNIRFGIWYISYLYEKFGDKSLTVAAYNAGPNKVEEWLENPDYSKDGKTFFAYPFKETERHVEKVLRAEKIYIKLYENSEGGK